METIKIVHVEDCPSDSELIVSEIKQNEINIDYTRVTTEDELMNALNKEYPDIILADYQLPNYNGKKALKTCASLYPDIPFIVISGTLGEERAVELLKYGASDYILKQNLTRLVPAIKYALNQKKLVLDNRKAEIKLMQSERKYRNIFETIQDVFCRTDLTGKILVISPSIYRLTGYTHSEMLNKNILALYEDQEVFNKKMELLKKQGEIWDFETVSKCKDGAHKYISINAHLFYDDKDQPCGIESIVRDISTRKKVEKELIAAKERAEESDRLKSAFLANISHEIRTPMNGIMGFANLLKDNSLEGKDKRLYLGMIQESGDRMLNLIDQIIYISKIDAGEAHLNLSTFNLNKYIKQLFQFFFPLAKKKGLELFYHQAYEDDLTMVYTDKEKLDTILINLLTNALKYTAEGKIKYGYRKIDDNIEFFVEDTGIGIEKEHQQFIFNRFYQVEQTHARKYEGVGLGLSICKAYIDMLDGHISVKSDLGKGSEFFFSIPNSPKILSTKK